MISTINVALPGGRVAFSTRIGGVSSGPFSSLNLGTATGDQRECVDENRRRLLAHLGIGRLAAARQVHAATIRDWESAPDGGPLEQADGHITRVPGLGLLVLAADCLPIALSAPGEVAMLHCGWRGLAAGIIDRALAGFEKTPAAAIGPGIGPCCYEVGAEVLAAFEDPAVACAGHMLDLKAIARSQLAAAGVTTIEDVDLCTSCRGDLFYSHRRDRGITGRQGGVAWIP